MIDPPTGTIKFLSVLWTKASTRLPLSAFPASSIICIHFELWTPYALLTMWGTPNFPHISATAGTSSAALGAKQEVVVITANTS